MHSEEPGHNLEKLFFYQPIELRIPELGPLITTIATFMERRSQVVAAATLLR